MRTRYYLTACLCFQNASLYLAEWLAFYSVLGVEHFYLVDNDSTDDYDWIIEPYLRRQQATVIRFAGRGIQQAAYEFCLQHYGANARWMLFCDDDEFLFPCADVPLSVALEPYEEFAGVAVSWMLYGSSGHQVRPDGLVITNYSMRGAVPDQHVKCIVDPSRVQKCAVIGHQFHCRGGQYVVDENGEPVQSPFRAHPTAERFRINHYVTKSIAELVERRSRIQANTGCVSPLSLEEWRALERTWNDVEDRVAFRYSDRIEWQLALMDHRRPDVAGVLVPA